MAINIMKMRVNNQPLSFACTGQKGDSHCACDGHHVHSSSNEHTVPHTHKERVCVKLCKLLVSFLLLSLSSSSLLSLPPLFIFVANGLYLCIITTRVCVCTSSFIYDCCRFLFDLVWDFVLSLGFFSFL